MFNFNYTQYVKFAAVEIASRLVEKTYDLCFFLKLIPDCTRLTGPPRKLTPEKKLHMLLMTRKSALSKSLSMPDMQTRVKKREQLVA
jgi:hypothetical protein